MSIRLAWYLAICIYAGTYVLLIPTWFLLRHHKKIVLDSHVNQVINLVFVEDYGYFLFTIAYLGSAVRYYPDIWNKDTRRLVRNYAINTVFGILVNTWFLGASILDRVDRATGGHCSVVAGTSKALCYAQGGQWLNGFDISGHYYIIVSMSLFCWQELLERSSHPLDDVDAGLAASRFSIAETGRKVVYILMAILLTIWYIEFAITSLFFHTIMEKFWGLVLGMMAPVALHVTDVWFSGA